MLGIPQFLNSTYEADDLIAHFALVNSYLPDIKIISADKDLTQLVTDNITTVSLASGYVKKDFEFTPATVIEKFGVPPSLIADYLAIIGDNSDNIAGIDGVGPKTASMLLNNFGPIKTWYNSIESLDISPILKQKLLDSKQLLYNNKQIISLKSCKDLVPESLSPQSCYLNVQELFDKYEMRKIRPEDFIVK